MAYIGTPPVAYDPELAKLTTLTPQQAIDLTGLSSFMGPVLASTSAVDAASKGLGTNTGLVQHFAAVTPPAGWLPADGSAVSRTTYAALFAVIGTTYGAGDGSTTFNLPDLRGYFIRSSGTNVDGTAAGTFGAKQADAFPSHTHNVTVTTWNSGGGDLNKVGYATGGTSPSTGPTFTSTAAGSGAETRPKNVALLACIKY